MPATGIAGSHAGANPGPACSRRRRNRGSDSRTTCGGSKTAIFSGEAGKVGGFVNACKLYIRMKIGGATVVEQVYWILSHVQGGLADI